MKKLSNVLGIILSIILTTSCEKKTVPPSLSTTTATEISTTTAVSGGIITADGGAPVLSRGVCWNISKDPTIDKNKTTVSVTENSFICDITQLSPKTQYFVRAFATNSAGTGYGESLSFTTIGDLPWSTANSATNIALDSARITGSVNPNSLSTVITFEWGTTTSYGNSVIPPQSPINGTSAVNVTSKLTGLTPGTTYHFRIKAENSLGIKYSEDRSFTTLGQVPLPIFKEATSIQVHSATINGSVNPNYLSSTVKFEWGTTTSYGNSVIPTQSPLTGSISVDVNANLTGLNPGTTYHFRIKAENSLGIRYSEDKTFTTLGQVPSTVSKEASGVQMFSATINGSVNPNYLSSTVTFEWGATSGYGVTIIPVQSPIDGATLINFSANLSGLTSGTTYHYRIVATNELGTSNSTDMTFTTYSVADIENNLYHTVSIGTQVWFAENLKTTKFNDGTSIQLITNQNDWNTATGYAYCWYDNNSANKELYGALYNWWAVDYSINSSKNICPSGWHVPAKAEWSTLLTYLIDNGFGNGGSGINIAKSMAATMGWNTDSNTGSVGNNLAANNRSGFSAVAGGTRTDGVEGFIQLGVNGAWWATPDNYYLGYSFWCTTIFNFESIVHQANNSRKAGLSIRCLKD
jgi:uncharacterized protein (TIGR02145 family)